MQRVLKGLQQQGLQLEACTCSPITGTDGNIEYLAWFKRVPKGDEIEYQAAPAESLPASFFESVDVSLVYRRQGQSMVLAPKTLPLEPNVREPNVREPNAREPNVRLGVPEGSS